MAQINHGALGGFSGKAGSVIGYKLRGKYFIKGLPRKITKAPSIAQLANRARFKLLQNWRSTFTAFFAMTFRNFRHLKSPQNAAHQFNKDLVQGQYPDYYLEPKHLCISSGTLAPLEQLQVHKDATHHLHFSWQRGQAIKAKALDFVAVMAWCPEANYFEADTCVARRGHLGFTFPLNFEKAYAKFHVYLTVLSEDYSNAAPSTYIGEFSV